MVIHKFCSSADEVDKFLNSKYVEVVAITKSAYCDGGGEVFTSYTIFYNYEKSK